MILNIMVKLIKWFCILYATLFIIVYSFTFSSDKGTKSLAYSYLTFLMPIDLTRHPSYLKKTSAYITDDKIIIPYKVKLRYRYAIDLTFCLKDAYNNKFFDAVRTNGAYYSIIIKHKGITLYNKVSDFAPYDKAIDVAPWPAKMGYPILYYTRCEKNRGYTSRIFSEELRPAEYEIIITPIDKEKSINILRSILKNDSFNIKIHPDMTIY